MSLKLTYLSDIMVFTNDSPSSMVGTFEVFEAFPRVSGLCVSILKSTVFAVGLSKQNLEADAAGFSISVLPINMNRPIFPPSSCAITGAIEVGNSAYYKYQPFMVCNIRRQLLAGLCIGKVENKLFKKTSSIVSQDRS